MWILLKHEFNYSLVKIEKIQERFLQNGDCKNIEKFCNEDFRFLCMPRFASVFVIQGSPKITIFYFSILNVYNVSIKTI